MLLRKGSPLVDLENIHLRLHFEGLLCNADMECAFFFFIFEPSELKYAVQFVRPAS